MRILISVLSIFLITSSDSAIAGNTMPSKKVFFGGCSYQENGARNIKEKESLGEFIERNGGVIRREYVNPDGSRGSNLYGINIWRGGKLLRRYMFSKDDKAAWNQELLDGDVIEVAEVAMWEPHKFTKEELKLPPVKFIHPEQNQSKPTKTGGDKPAN